MDDQHYAGPSQDAPVVDEPKPWGLWATIGFSLIVLAVWFLTQIVVVIGYAVVRTLAGDAFDPTQLTHDGLLMALCAWAGLPLGVGLQLLFIRLRRGWTFAGYLALRRVSWLSLLGWCGGILAFIAAADGLAFGLGREITPQELIETYRTAAWPPLLWSALLLAAPIFEETFFRGFMFLGILRSRLGAVGAIGITAAAWAVIHTQYDAFGMATIFVSGIVLGTARLKTGSLYTTLTMHALMNLVAVLELVFLTQA